MKKKNPNPPKKPQNPKKTLAVTAQIQIASRGKKKNQKALKID